jgi:long-chain acyl-CoA synthetase
MIASGGPRNSAPGTLTRLLFDAVATYHKPDALQVKRNGRYQPISHDTLLERIPTHGVRSRRHRRSSRRPRGDSLENCPEWAIADYACSCSAQPMCLIYPNLPPDQICYILRDSGAVAIFVSTAEQLAKVAAVRGECSALRRVIHSLIHRAPRT